MNLDIEVVRDQERETTDLPLSVLYAWQRALDVPFCELLVEAGDSLTSPVTLRDDRNLNAVFFYNRKTIQYSYSLPTSFDESTQKISYHGHTSPKAVWQIDTDPCAETIFVDQEGAYDLSPMVDAQGNKLDGRLVLGVSIERTYEGTCAQSLLDVASCIQNSANCKQSTTQANVNAQQIMAAKFSPFVDTGLITLDQLDKVSTTYLIVNTR